MQAEQEHGNPSGGRSGVHGRLRIIFGGVLLAVIGVLAAGLAPAGGGATVATAAAPAATTPPSGALTRYSLVGGCYRLRSATSGAELAVTAAPFRMQAATLGQYLLYGARADYLSATDSGATQTEPGTGTVWRVDGSATRGFSMHNLGSGADVPVRFVPATGCATYPEAGVDATGTPAAGPSPTGEVLGTVEGHAHVTAYDFLGGAWHCGQLFSPYGAPYALPASCADHEQGTNGEFESFLDFGGATRPSDFHGWPTFHGWPSPTTLAEEGDYYTGIERAWKAGLRLMVNDLVDNEVLCRLMTTRVNPCNDMASVHIQSRDLYAAQDYIDAQSGGPGRGWFRIVTDPFQARRVINQGKLAVIEGVEMSRIFGCGEVNNVPQCDQSQVDAGIKDFESVGVRTFFPVHEFDNGFGGSKMIAGETGAVVNSGNRQETGSFFTTQSCPAAEQDAPQFSPAPGAGALAGLLNGPAASVLGGNPVPVYDSGPQCNVRGLTDLGGYLIHQMIKQHAIIQLDHSDSKTADAALKIAESAHYAGVVSAHCCSSPQLFQRVYATGGYVTAPASPAAAFVTTEKADRAAKSSRYHFGFGYGSDMDGLAEQPGPSSDTPITYPFKSYDGKVTFDREQWGQRTFDLNQDGLANYGLYADWLRDVQQVGGSAVMHDMFQGAEGYLQMWERADGVPSSVCRSSRGALGPHGTRALVIGATSTTALFALGQPASRPGAAYRYCVDGAPGKKLAGVFDAGGRAALWITNARGYEAGGVRPGDTLRSRAKRVAPGLVTEGRYLFVLRGRHVLSVAVASPALLGRPSALRAALAASGVR